MNILHQSYLVGVVQGTIYDLFVMYRLGETQKMLGDNELEKLLYSDDEDLATVEENPDGWSSGSKEDGDNLQLSSHEFSAESDEKWLQIKKKNMCLIGKIKTCRLKFGHLIQRIPVANSHACYFLEMPAGRALAICLLTRSAGK